MRIIAFANQKGGPGKTTAAMLIAAELHHRGRRVLVVDADPQGSAQKWETRVVEGYPPVPFRVEHLVGLDERQFAAAITKRVGDADYVIIDTPPRLDSKELYAAAFVADLIIIPFVPDAAHVDALEEVLPLFARANEARARLGSPTIEARLLINRHDTRRAGERAISSHAAEIADFPRFRTAFGNRAPFQNAWNYRTTLNAVAGANAPARREVADLATEIEDLLDGKG